MNNVIELADSTKISATELKVFERIDSLFEDFAGRAIDSKLTHLENLIKIVAKLSDREIFHVKHLLERVGQQLKAELNYLASSVGYAIQSFGVSPADSNIYEKIDSLFEDFAKQVIDVQLEYAERLIKAATNLDDSDSFHMKHCLKRAKEQSKAELSNLASSVGYAVRSFEIDVRYRNI